MKEQIEKLFEAVKADFNRFIDNKEMQEEFANELVCKEGRKYVKVMTRNGGTVWGFIVNVENDKQFKYGDILKPANFNTPVRNAARANVFNPETFEDGIRWTGPAYLR